VSLGVLLGFLSSNVPLAFRVAFASILAVIGIVMAVLEFADRCSKPLQWDREPPKQWVHRGPLHWAPWNGATLGIGVMSRVGFWLWYVVPVGAFLIGDALFGALLYGMYGLTRGAAVFAIILGLSRWIQGDDVGMWLIRRNPRGRIVASATLGVVSAVVMLTVGI